jgi:hypothetical protein
MSAELEASGDTQISTSDPDLYDKGYHTGSQFEYAQQLGINVLVSIPEVSSHAPDLAYDVQHFSYDKAADHYICPAQQILSTNGRNYTKSNGRSNTVRGCGAGQTL